MLRSPAAELAAKSCSKAPPKGEGRNGTKGAAALLFQHSEGGMTAPRKLTEAFDWSDWLPQLHLRKIDDNAV